MKSATASGSVGLQRAGSPLYSDFLVIALSLASALSSLGCGRTTDQAQAPELQPHAISSASPTTTASQSSTATPFQVKQSATSPPEPKDVRDAMTRVFAKVAVWDEQSAPGFLVGDFNGDGSEDLAVITRALDNSFGDINSELANWTLEDPRAAALSDRKKEAAPGKPVQVEKGNSLLTIIHGVGPKGWRNPEARQTFLLKNGVGSNMLVQSLEKVRGDGGKQKLPALRGDTINETLDGRRGMLFWTGAKYAWYSSER